MRTFVHGIAIFFALVFGMFGDGHAQAQPSEGISSAPRLRKVVVLSRHGVRAPTQSAATLKEWSARPWPRWPVARGYLTPRGGQLVTAMWENMRAHYASLGLLPAAACPPQGSVFVRADVDQRTRETARALLDGVAPDCGLNYVAEEGRIDPLFHPVKSGFYTFDPATVTADVLAMSQGGLEAVQQELAPALSRLSVLAAPPGPKFCAKYQLPPDCTLADAPSHIRVEHQGHGVGISGALGMASDMAEIFLLEYGQWPDSVAAWGQADAQVMAEVLPVHTRVFNMVNRASVVARARGSALLRAINAALQGQHADPRYNAAALVVFVGHDTNIANVGALLGVHWQPPGYPADSTTPAAALCFELWEHAPKKAGHKGEQEVRITFYAQPLEVLHRPWEKHSAASLFAPEAAALWGKTRLSLEEFSALSHSLCSMR